MQEPPDAWQGERGLRGTRPRRCDSSSLGLFTEIGSHATYCGFQWNSVDVGPAHWSSCHQKETNA